MRVSEETEGVEKCLFIAAHFIVMVDPKVQFI